MSNDRRNKGVGFGRPPKEHQFKPGRSGNPGGRPKGRRKARSGEIDIAGILNADIPVKTAKGEQVMSAFEVGCRALAKRAVKDLNLRAAIQFFKRCEKYELIRTPPRRRTHGVIVIPQGATKEEVEWQFWEARQERPKRTKLKGQKVDRAIILDTIAYEQHVLPGSKKKSTTLALIIRVIQEADFAANPTASRMIEELRDRYEEPVGETTTGYLVVPGMAKNLEEFKKEVAEQQRPHREG